MGLEHGSRPYSKIQCDGVFPDGRRCQYGVRYDHGKDQAENDQGAIHLATGKTHEMVQTADGRWYCTINNHPRPGLDKATPK